MLSLFVTKIFVFFEGTKHMVTIQEYIWNLSVGTYYNRVNNISKNINNNSNNYHNNIDNINTKDNNKFNKGNDIDNGKNS